MAGQALPPVVGLLRLDASQFSVTLGEVKAQLASMRADTAAASAAVADSASKEVTAAEAAASDVGGAADKQAKAGEDLEARTKSSGSSIGSTLSSVGGMAAKVFAGGLLAAGVASVKMAGDFQESMTTLVTGAGESQSNIKMVSDGILKMAVNTGTSTSQLSSGMYLIESAGFHGAAGLQVLQAAAEGAKIGNADLKTVADGVTTAMTDYGLSAKDATSVTSQLVETVASGKTTMGDLGGSLSAILPVASSAKVGLSQVLGAMATMTGEGVSASQASQDLANTMRALQSPSAQATQEMAAMGLNSQTVSQQLGSKGLTGTMAELTTAITSHMGPAGLVLQNAFNQSKSAAADANAMLEKLPASIQGLAKQYEAGTITQAEWMKALKLQNPEVASLGRSFATSVKNADGFNAVLKSGGPAAQTYNTALGQMTGGATGLATSLALTGGHMSTFNANVQAVTSAAAGGSKSVQGWSEVQKDFNFKMSQAKETVETLVIKLGMVLIPIIEQAAKTISNMVQWLTQHKTVAIALAIVIGGVLVAAIVAWTVSLFAAGGALAFLMSPIVLVVGGIALLAAGIYMLVTHWTQAWDYIKLAVSQAWQIVDGIWQAMNNTARSIFGGIESFFAGIWDSITKTVETAVKDIVGFFTGIPTAIEKVFTGAVDWLAQAGDDIMNGLIGAINQGWSNLYSFFTGIPNDILGVFDGAITWLEGIGEDIINGLINGINSAISGIGSAIAGIPGDIIGGLGSLLGISSPSKVMADRIGQWIPKGIAKGILDNKGAVTSALGQVTGGLGTSVGAASVGIGSTVSPATTTASSAPTAGPLTVHLDINGQTFATQVFPDILTQFLRTQSRNATAGQLVR